MAALAALLALVAAAPAHAADPDALPRPVTVDDTVPGHVLLAASELEGLRERLATAVFRAEASHLPPEPYVQEPLVYDGALVAVRDGAGELAFLTAAAWLTEAERVVLLDPRSDTPVAMVIERLDTRFDLALLRLADSSRAEHYAPLELATATPMVTYSLLSPGTPYEQLVTLSVVPGERDPEADGPLYWPTTLTASNGYPVVDADARLIAVHARRSLHTNRGLAVGWPLIAEFFAPPDPERAKPRAPDRSLETTLPRANIAPREPGEDRAGAAAPKRYRFGR